MPEALTIEDQIVAALRRIMRAIELHSHQLVEVYDLTGPQLVTLQAAARLGTASVVTLARTVHLSSATVAGILARLEKRGLIERARDSQDRRSVIITVTGKGHELLAAAPSPLQDQFRRELARLQGWEQTMILATLQRIASMMDAETLDASPVLVSGPSLEAAEGLVPDGMPVPAAAPSGSLTVASSAVTSVPPK